MPGEFSDRPGTLLQSVTRLIDTALSEGTGYEGVTNILALLCLLIVLSRNQGSVAQSASSSAGNNMQKLLGDLVKGESAGHGGDALASLLPLLNSPQLKSKLNPSNIATILGLLNNLGGLSGEKHESSKLEKSSGKSEDEQAAAIANMAVSSAAASLPASEMQKQQPLEPPDANKGVGRYLNWKSNF